MSDADIDAWIQESVVTPQRRAPIRPPAARPLGMLEEPTFGRLELTAEMGRHR
jgi:hypothetical protein